MTLYLKYRPQTIEELDLETVRESLKKIVASSKIPHAFLFSGPKGTGKTSAARILAKVVNCQKPLKSGEHCNKCEQCKAISRGASVDVIEMDAASNRGIDDIRVLRENINLAPVSAKKKVYIIDEAHMMTVEAANAFLKTLEEPPSHVLFILATTNPEKLPGTIRSRLTSVVFRKANAEEIKRQLERVVKAEKIKVETGTMEIITKAADGSFRDAVKILEQLALSQKKISQKDAQELLFQSQKIDPRAFLLLLADKNSKEALVWVEDLVNQGLSLKVFIDNLIGVLREALLAKEGITNCLDIETFSKQEIITLIELLTGARKDMAYLPLEQLALEVVIVKWCPTGQSHALQETVKKKVAKEAEGKEVERVEKATKPAQDFDDGVWQQALISIRAKNTSVGALLRAARPLAWDGRELKLGVYYQFHKEQLEVDQNKRTLEDILTQIMGSPVRVFCQLTQREVSVKPKEDTLTESSDKDIMQIAKEVFS